MPLTKFFMHKNDLSGWEVAGTFFKQVMVDWLAIFHAKSVLKLNRIVPGFLILVLVAFSAAAEAGATRPNIVYILCDDLGYGDVRCLNPQGKIATPHMDRLGAAGMIFTDAHSSSAVCTPSRYTILTGRYNWRSAMKHGV